MLRYLILGLCLISTVNIHGQNARDTIETRKAMGVIFLQNGKKLAPRDLLQITKSNTESYQEMKIAKSNYDAGSIFGFAGGFMVGWPLGTAIAGGQPNWTLAAVGAGLIIVSIPFSTAYSRHARNAVTIFNSGLRQTGHNGVKWDLGFTSSGAGFTLRF
jgi:hypothetical protein